MKANLPRELGGRGWRMEGFRARGTVRRAGDKVLIQADGRQLSRNSCLPKTIFSKGEKVVGKEKGES